MAPTLYRIRVKGHLRPEWSEWFDNMTIIPEKNGDTTLSGLVVDQAALHGLLVKVRDLGLELVSVERTALTAQGDNARVTSDLS